MASGVARRARMVMMAMSCVFCDSAPQEEENRLRLYMRMGIKNLRAAPLALDALRLLTTDFAR
jgi:hypothetical protein